MAKGIFRGTVAGAIGDKIGDILRGKPKQTQVFRVGENLPPSGGAASSTPTYYQSGSYGGYNAAAARAAEAARLRALAEAEARNTINAGYDDYVNRDLNKLLEMINVDQSTNLNKIQNRFGTEKTTLDSKLDRTLSGLANARTDVENTKKTSISDVGRDFARKLQGGALSLSARGASDSSAFGQMGLGLAGAQAQSRGDIFNQANSQFGQIGNQEAGAQSDFNDQLRLLEDWQRNESQNLLQKYADQRTRIEREKAGANLERSQALANLNKALAGGLASRLGAFQTQFAQMSKELADSLVASNPNLSPTAISQSYTPQAITRQQIPGLSFGEQSPAQAQASYLPQPARKKEDTGV